MNSVELLDRAQHQCNIELLPRGLLIHELEIPRKAVADYLSQVPEEERDAHLIEAVEVGVFCLERAAAARDMDFVRSQVRSIIDDVEQSVLTIPKVVETGLAQRLGADDGQILAPIRNMVEATSRTMTERVNGVRELLTNEIDPAKKTSTLGRALGQLHDILDGNRKDSIQATLVEAVRCVTGEDGTLAKSVKATVAEAIRPLADEVNRISKQIAAAEAAEEAVAGTTKKGLPYEEDVLAAVIPRSTAMGAEVHHVGPDNRAGDVLVRFGDASVAAGLCAVIEARDRTTPLGRKAISDIVERAMTERGGNAAIYVSRSRDGLAAEIGEWAEGQCDHGPWIATTHEYLFVALRFLLVLHRLTVMRESQASVDLSAVGGQLDRIRTALRKVGTIKRNVTAIRDSAGTIQDEAETLQSDIRNALLAIEETLHSAAKA